MKKTFTIKNNTNQLLYTTLNCIKQNDLETILFSSTYISKNTTVETRAYCSDDKQEPTTLYIQFWKPDTLSGQSIGQAKVNIMDSTVSENNSGFDISISNNVITISTVHKNIDLLFIVLIGILLIGGIAIFIYFWRRKQPQQYHLPTPNLPTPELTTQKLPSQSIIQTIGTNFM